MQRSKISELIATLLPALKGRGNLASYIIAQAQLKFTLLFGYEMKELERMTQKKTAGGAGGWPHYLSPPLSHGPVVFR